ncbi:hypothetical protein AVEN_146817-1 [Araneus ventricosus]|uniref:Uncharacterized protein n=1 Tax=Araneus ventricosus TaxID=182803 RepID=A0A4Y2QM79_ARAVE|nr:hypothetical protein AVEN_146817-1 [Araneus ventricosus]
MYDQPTNAGVVRNFGRGVPAHLSFSSSDCGSKLRAPSQNSPRVTSKYQNLYKALNLFTKIYPLLILRLLDDLGRPPDDGPHCLESVHIHMMYKWAWRT